MVKITKEAITFLKGKKEGTFILQEPEKGTLKRTEFLVKMKAPHTDKKDAFIALLYSENDQKITGRLFQNIERTFYINPKRDILADSLIDMKVEGEEIRTLSDFSKEIFGKADLIWKTHLQNLPLLKKEEWERKEERRIKNVLSHIISDSVLTEEDLLKNQGFGILTDLLKGESAEIFLKGWEEEDKLRLFLMKKAEEPAFRGAAEHSEELFRLQRHLLQEMEENKLTLFVKKPNELRKKMAEIKEIRKNLPKNVSMAIQTTNGELLFVKVDAMTILKVISSFYAGKKTSIYIDDIDKSDREKLIQRYGYGGCNEFLKPEFIKKLIYRNKTIFEMDTSIIDIEKMFE